jgi:ubiquinone/menaquinone biosynthesis C-methylase UbiE
LTKNEEKAGSPHSVNHAYEKLVRRYYSGMGLREWRRLTRDAYHLLELNTTIHYLKKYLPEKGFVLDAGGGPGKYTVELARLGYDVALLDFTPELLEMAKRQVKKARIQKRVKQITQGTIYDLSQFRNDPFDAVICLGCPLSHVLNPAKRGTAIDELIRVTKKGAPIFVSVIGHMALLVTELVHFPHEIELELFPRIRDTGDYHGGYGFAPCHFYTPYELEKQFAECGVTVLEMVGLEGLANVHRKETNRLFKKYPDAWEIWWQTHLKTCTDSTSVGISEHFMIICRK